MHTLQWLQLVATTMVGLQAPPRSLVAYQSRYPVHFHGNIFMNFGFDNFGNTMIFADRHISPLVLSFGMARSCCLLLVSGSCCLFLMMKMFHCLKYNQSRIAQARDKQVADKQDQSMKGCSHKELDKENYQQ